MRQTPQERKPLISGEVAPGLQGDSIVISGMSGIFPMSESVAKLSNILYDKINPVTSENIRWKWQHPEASDYIGKVPDLDRFDSKFFMVHHYLGNCMDPMARKALEHSYQAMYDAGFSPTHLKGKKIGVYMATSLSETEKTGFVNIISEKGFGITGCSRAMCANRISYWLNLNGPSMTLDADCCASMVALEEACSAINSGICEAAIVGGANLALFPQTQVHYNRCIHISPGDKTRSFDENANGCTKSEAVCILFLQKAKNALRAYAEVVHVKSEFISSISGETGQVFGFNRDPNRTATFIEQFYSEASVPPQSVEYIEAFGSATPEADKAELQAIEKVFCDNRTNPLLVGSVISNVGYTVAAFGVTAIIKVLLGYHHGLIASNLHCETPRQDIAAIREGRMCVVTEHQPFHGTYAAVNCLSVTGVNSHLLLRRCTKPKTSRFKASFPILVTLSARQEEYLEPIFSNLKSRSVDAEELALLHNIHSTNISGHLGRGYIILDTNEEQKTISLSEKAEHSDETQRPLWFVYSGMGSQWAGMGTQLMRIPIFAAAIERCRTVLEPKGIDIVHIVTSLDKTLFDNVLNSFVGIAAIQIGLTDILTALRLNPDKIIGHSVGELGCAYADGCLTAEEMILSAYSRGKVSNDTPLLRGAMAAVGLGYKQMRPELSPYYYVMPPAPYAPAARFDRVVRSSKPRRRLGPYGSIELQGFVKPRSTPAPLYETTKHLLKICPPAIDIACHNGPDSCTISGPEKNIQEFVFLLRAEGVFAKEVPSANIAYHSRYVADAGPGLLRMLSEVIREPRARSKRWLSTSMPQERWNDSSAKCGSAEYFTNNLLSSVYFEETCRLIPSNAVLIEIAPHGLLQAILKRSLPATCTNVPLTQRRHKDNMVFLLDAIGNLYVGGYSPQVHAIYPKVEFPVSTGTPHLAHLVKWYHTDSWVVPAESISCIKMAPSCKLVITTYDDEHSFLKGNIIQGKVLYPFAGALVAVWDTIVMALGRSKKEMSVKFQDVHLYSQPIVHDEKQLKLDISVQRGNGRFQVLNGDSKIATGFVIAVKKPHRQSEIKPIFKNVIIDSEELYRHFNNRGFFYRGEFQIIHSVDETLTTAQLIWNNNWVTLIDGLLQLNALRHTYEGVSQPTYIRELTIDTKMHINSTEISPSSGKTVIIAAVDEVLDCTKCGGILIRDVKFRNVPSSVHEIFKLMTPTLSGNNDKVMENENELSLEKVAARKHVALQMASIGDLGTLHWQEPPGVSKIGVNVTVSYAGINVLDVNRANGAIPNNDEKYYGMDFSGITERGERVMGLVRNGAASTVVSAQPELLWPVPAHWTLEEAATVPLAYVQAYYCLCIKNKIQSGWSILIHGAAGALGQAAVSVALARGCRVFATVADSAKKRFLLRLFPQLNDNSIGNSRDSTFVDMVIKATNGEGCPVVISCVKEDLKNYSWKCASDFGVTIDTVQIPNREKYEYGMFNLSRERSYIAVNFNSIFDTRNDSELKELLMLVSEGIILGHVRPLTRVTVAPHEAPRAFRLVAASRHRGRVLLCMTDQLPHAQPRIVCSPENIHVIVWDGSSFGVQLADKLISRGASKLRIHCLNPSTRYLLKLRLWQKMGVKVDIFYENLTNSNPFYNILHETDQDGHIEGIYVIVGVSDEIQQDVLTKIIVNLDNISREVCPQLQYFAVITKCNIEQHTSLCLSRFKDGLPATLLHLPGYSIENTELVDITEISWNRAAANVTELALRLKNPILVAQSKTVDKLSLSKLLAALADNCDEDTMEQNVVSQQALPVIKVFLRDVYHMTLEDEDILKFTKKKILDIEMSLAKHNYEETKGLGAFISYVDPDEIRATTDFMPLNTLVGDVKKMAGGIDDSKPHLFIIPGLEGHHARFHTMCDRLKLSAVVLQPGLDRPNETVQQLALRYSKILLDGFKLRTNFYLLGNECGIFVALELAYILENNGLTGTVYCLGDGPEELQALLEAETRAFGSEEALQEGVVRHMFALMARSCSLELVDSALRGCASWSARVDACVRTLLGRVSHSAQYVRAHVEAAYARIGAARNYNAVPHALRSALVLLRTRRLPPYSGAECSLQRYSQHALVVEELAASMAQAAADLRVPAIINRYLDSYILESYNNCNLCETYAVSLRF